MDKVAVVILNWNGRELLRSFLPSVVRTAGTAGAVVYVADNASTDGSAEWVCTTCPSVRVLRLEENYGFAEGYNRALRQVEATYAVLLNSDVEVAEHWLEPLVAFMDAHPEVAACQPKVRSWRERGRFEYAGAAGGFVDRYGYPYCRGRLMETVEADRGQYDAVCPLFWATGAALFIRLADYREAGGLDGRFFAHMEEIDLCWRLRARNKGVVCVPQSVVYHVGGGTLKKGSPRKTFLNFRNNLLMLYKNLPDDELASVMRVRWWLDCLAAFSFAAKLRFADARAVWQARRAYRKLRPTFKADRERNLRSAVLSSIPERWPGSILWQYYVKRKKHFSQLG